MDFNELETERLLLRRLEESDWEMVSFLRSDHSINAFVKRPPAETKGEALDFIQKIGRGIDNQQWYYWKITERKQGEMIGSICLWNFSKDRKVAEIGYDLSPEFQGRGIMHEAVQCILDFGFDQLNVTTVEAFTHHLNVPSKKLLERSGFRWVPGKKDEHNADNVVYEIKNPTR